MAQKKKKVPQQIKTTYTAKGYEPENEQFGGQTTMRSMWEKARNVPMYKNVELPQTGVTSRYGDANLYYPSDYSSAPARLGVPIDGGLVVQLAEGENAVSPVRGRYSRMVNFAGATPETFQQQKELRELEAAQSRRDAWIELMRMSGGY